MPRQRLCVLDAGPIIHLDQLGAFLLLNNLGQIIVPETVSNEVERHRPGLIERFQVDVVSDVASVPFRVALAAGRHSLHAGEIAGLAWAEMFGADLFVSDDHDARLAAKELGYAITGTIGIILTSMEGGALDKYAAVALLERIPKDSTLHVHAELLAATIARIR